MKFVEKKCPNCGAGLKFDDGASSVACEYCNQTFYIQRDEKKYARLDEAHRANAYRFVDEVGKPVVKAFATVHIAMMIIPIVMFVVVAGGIGMSIYSFSSRDNSPTKVEHNNNNSNYEETIKQEMEDKFNEARKGIVTKLEQIDSTSLETFHDTSETDLVNYQGSSVHGNYKVTKSWNSVGVYLLVGKETNKNILYDVMAQTYKNKKTGKVTTLYSAVKFDDLKLTKDGVVNNDYMGWPEVPSYKLPESTFNSAYGYESVEKLYNQLVRSQSGEYTIEASKGLYVES